MPRLPMFLIFDVIDPRGLIRHGQLVEKGTLFAVKRSSSRRHVERWLQMERIKQVVPTGGICLICSCTDDDCASCIGRTGEPCHWLDPEQTVCSACYGAPTISRSGPRRPSSLHRTANTRRTKTHDET